MSEEKVGFLRMEDATQDELASVAEQIEENLPDNYNIVVMNEIDWADPKQMMELLISMFHLIEANCFDDKADANPDQQNLKDLE